MTEPTRTGQLLSALMALRVAALMGLSALSCATFTISSTYVSAPDVRPSRVDQLSEEFADEILTLVVWEQFEYVYGEGGEQTLALKLAPPKLLHREELVMLGRRTKDFSFARKVVDGTDEGSWERGHRALGLLLVAPNGDTATFIARDDPPRDFSIAWWPLSTSSLSPDEAANLASAMDCRQLDSDGGTCGLGPLEELVNLETLTNVEAEVPPLILEFGPDRREPAVSFLAGLR